MKDTDKKTLLSLIRYHKKQVRIYEEMQQLHPMADWKRHGKRQAKIHRQWAELIKEIANAP